MGTSIERIYQEIFGNQVLKEGEALERLAAIVTKILNDSADVQHDARVRGQISKSLYQIDIDERSGGGFIAGEAKDYEERQSPVGRPDVQKLAAALPDIAADSGKFFSSTRFTKPARQYASTSEAIVGKPIELNVLRAFAEKDLDGRIKRIILQFYAVFPNWNSPHCLLPRLSESAKVELRNAFGPDVKEGDTFQLGVDKFFDRTGHQVASVEEITRDLCHQVKAQETKMSGFLPTCGYHLKVNEALIEIEGFDYDVSIITEKVSTIVIEAADDPTITLCDGAGVVKRLFTRDQLHQFRIDAEGNVEGP